MTMTHSTEHDMESGEKTLVCPICAQTFICSLSSTCWCATKVVPARVHDYLAGRYKTCICSTCLDMLVEKAGAGESP